MKAIQRAALQLGLHIKRAFLKKKIARVAKQLADYRRRNGLQP